MRARFSCSQIDVHMRGGPSGVLCWFRIRKIRQLQPQLTNHNNTIPCTSNSHTPSSSPSPTRPHSCTPPPITLYISASSPTCKPSPPRSARPPHPPSPTPGTPNAPSASTARHSINSRARRNGAAIISSRGARGRRMIRRSLRWGSAMNKRVRLHYIYPCDLTCLLGMEIGIEMDVLTLWCV
jgi:hypothetical protein